MSHSATDEDNVCTEKSFLREKVFPCYLYESFPTTRHAEGLENGNVDILQDTPPCTL